MASRGNGFTGIAAASASSHGHSIERTQQDDVAANSTPGKPLKDESALVEGPAENPYEYEDEDSTDEECDSADDDDDEETPASMAFLMTERGVGTVVKQAVRVDGNGNVAVPVKK